MTATKIDKTYMMKGEEVDPEWLVVDAEGMLVGRLATQIATVLMGKHKPTYTPHVLSGDYVIVLNCDKVRFSGDSMAHSKNEYVTTKMARKTYDWYTGYPGGRRVVSALQMWERKPEEVLRRAVRRMLPKNKLGRHMLSRLKLYTTAEHPHQAQQPQAFPEYLLPSK